MIEDIKSFFWFLFRGPKYYSTLIALIYSKLTRNKDTSFHVEIATNWCRKNLVSVEQCLKNIGLSSNDIYIDNAFDEAYKSRIYEVINNSESNFGGPGHVDLIYTICERFNIKNAIETGVAYGWSSASILRSLSKRDGKLISIDMPMLKQTDYHLIGIAVESKLQANWELRREPDRYGLPRAIKEMNGPLELVHYDSDKSYHGRIWSQEIIWRNLKNGGIFISDDIEDNTAFMEFTSSYNLKFNVLEFEGKFVGVIKK
jgi:predicted O-methyltransferase YrrM